MFSQNEADLIKELRQIKKLHREHQYGGAVFHANCPHCGRKLKMPPSLSVNKFMDDGIRKRTVPSILANCTKCGIQRIGVKRYEPNPTP